MAQVTGRPVPLLATAAVGGLVLAASALRAGTGRSVLDSGPHGTGPLTGHGGFLVLLALAVAAGGALLVTNYRRAVQHIDGPNPVAERLRDAALVLLTAAAVVVPVAVLLSYQGVQDGLDTPGDGNTPSPAPTVPRATQAPAQHAADTPAADGSSFDLFHLLLLVVAVLSAVVLAVALVRWLRWYLAGRSESGTRPITGVPETTESALAGAVASGRRALHGEDARTAVIACYAAMESTLGRSGVARLASDSPTDLLDRAVTGGTLTGDAARTLTALFREARYSSHPMDDGHLLRARTALDAIAGQLAAVTGPDDPDDLDSPDDPDGPDGRDGPPGVTPQAPADGR
ncbi:DUF4129 domain-containing protein [Streptomyces sp. H10-C2]|uniref:DUF4129 domain-containing protein n=1 Tax=unclassified Streptomyces TaxID=2593676 RepID=UPI0024BB2C69|nr:MULTISPECIES: DUF4129 domain-containing protein [unclassified Streptomyces]MDJ0340569.1 DUF4129 domain-containing protein [Streptomyces sp. PH10-H1]MDJ0370217.1 DUF4129 domain-containing protein [Streptomyces sp. H10-C2]